MVSPSTHRPSSVWKTWRASADLAMLSTSCFRILLGRAASLFIHEVRPSSPKEEINVRAGKVPFHFSDKLYFNNGMLLHHSRTEETLSAL